MTLITITLLCLIPGISVADGILIRDLRCEYLNNPLGIDATHPRLSWTLKSDTRSQKQTAYRILVSSSDEQLDNNIGDLWDSGKVLSTESLHHRYQGTPLASRHRYFWKVQIWDKGGRPSAWTQPQQWTMGILSHDEWNGKWIECNLQPNRTGPAHYIRKEVPLHKPVRRATARFACLGFVDLMVNGKKPDDSVMLATPYTNPQHRVKYVTHDVTKLMHKGDNCIGAIVGNGYNSPPSRGWNKWQTSKGLPRLLLEIEIEFTDGSRTFIGTDQSWKFSIGRIQYNDFWVKEIHDLRQEQVGWNLAGFDASNWQKVAPANPPKGTLRAARIRPVKQQESVKPLRREGNKYFFDKVYTGFPRIHTRGKIGDVVAVRGRDVHAMRGVFGPVVIDFTLKDDSEVTLEPRFFAHTIGPTLEIEGVSPLPQLEDVSIVRVHGDLQKTGEFECSNPLFNKLHQIGRRTHLNYVLYYPNDPTREKSGWSEDIQNMFDSASYMTDTAVMYEMWWQDFADTQLKNGYVCSVAPTNVGYVKTWNDPWWGGMIVYTPWRHYEFYGDKQVLAQAYEPMKRYVAYLTKLADSTGGVLQWSGASDWIEVGIKGWGPPKRTPRFLVSTMAWYYYSRIVERTAEILGRQEDAKIHKELADRIRKTFNDKHFDPKTGVYAKATDSQASLIMPLYFGVVPKGKEELVLKQLEDNIRKRGNHLSTGFVSNPYLLHGLTDLGRANLVGKIVNQKDYPSFNSISKYGVFMETWTGGMAQMPSLGGSCVGWFYRALLGIRSDMNAPGFKHFIIKPEIMPEVTWARGYYDSIRGRIVSDWKIKSDLFTLKVAIPANTTATVYIPATTVTDITESGKQLLVAEGVKFVKIENNTAVLNVNSGTYEFVSTHVTLHSSATYTQTSDNMGR